LAGGGECREAKFTLLGLSLAEVSALVFMGFMFFSLLLLVREMIGKKKAEL